MCRLLFVALVLPVFLKAVCFVRVQHIIFAFSSFRVLSAEWLGPSLSPSYRETCVVAAFKDYSSLHESG